MSTVKDPLKHNAIKWKIGGVRQRGCRGVVVGERGGAWFRGSCVGNEGIGCFQRNGETSGRIVSLSWHFVFDQLALLSNSRTLTCRACTGTFLLCFVLRGRCVSRKAICVALAVVACLPSVTPRFPACTLSPLIPPQPAQAHLGPSLDCRVARPQRGAGVPGRCAAGESVGLGGLLRPGHRRLLLARLCPRRSNDPRHWPAPSCVCR